MSPTLSAWRGGPSRLTTVMPEAFPCMPARRETIRGDTISFTGAGARWSPTTTPCRNPQAERDLHPPDHGPLALLGGGRLQLPDQVQHLRVRAGQEGTAGRAGSSGRCRPHRRPQGRLREAGVYQPVLYMREEENQSIAVNFQRPGSSSRITTRRITGISSWRILIPRALLHAGRNTGISGQGRLRRHHVRLARATTRWRRRRSR